MSKELIDHGFGVIETRETYYTEQSVNELKQRITDLEAKLAEMTDKYNACQEARKLEIEFNRQDKDQLKQQLAEKDKEIYLVKDTLKHHINIYNSLFEKRNQDKIELLEKARTQVAQLEVIGFPEYSCSDGFESCQYRVDDIIDTLIKEIKGEKDERIS